MLPDQNRKVPRNLTFEKVYNYALELFCYDRDKVNSWWISGNEDLGGMSPYEMVKNGKGRKLIRIMEKCGV